jgi:hypothetical protein
MLHLGIATVGTFIATRQYYIDDANCKFERLSEQTQRSYDTLVRMSS